MYNVHSPNMKNKKSKVSTVPSYLFTHIRSIERVRKDMRDRKDMRGIKYTY